MSREAIKDIFPVCEQLGIGFVPYSPLCRAYLAGTLTERTKFVAGNDNRPTLLRYTLEAIQANWKIIDLLTEFGNQRGVTPAQVSLAWLLAQKPWVVPIPGTTKMAHLQENLGSAEFRFTAEDLQKFTADLIAINIVGDRYPGGKAK